MKFIVSFLLLASLLPGQTQLFSLSGEKIGDGFGRSLAFLGDVDGDGISDLLIGGAGYAQIRSGSHGALLLRLTGASASEDFGHSVLGPGDLDGDGRADFIISSPLGGSQGEGEVRVYSGKTGKVLYKVKGDRSGDRFGFALGAVGDLDGDGRPDFGVGAPQHDNIGIDAGMIRIYSGKTGKAIFYYTGVKAGGGFGSSLCAIGDLDLDGVGDILIGASKGSYARIYSAKKASLLRMIQGAPGSELGAFVMLADDLNNDTIMDYWISAPEEINKASTFTKGALRRYSGKTGMVLQTLFGPASLEKQKTLSAPAGSSAFGWSLSAAGDVDGDGSADLLVADPFASTSLLSVGRVQLYSGKTGSVLATWTGTLAGDLLGSYVLGAVDFDGDSVPDIVVSSFSTGKVQLYSGKTKLLLKTLVGNAKDGFGSTLLSHPDLDADKWPELLVASPYFDSLRGKLELISSKSGKVLKTWTGANKGDSFGVGVGLLADRDGDGLPELLVGSPTHKSSAGRAQILASKKGAVLLDLIGSQAGDRLGEQLTSPGDLDGDGTADIYVAAPGASSGKGEIHAYSGRNAVLLYKIVGQITKGRLGTRLCLLGDLDGDDLPELLAGAPTDSSASLMGPGSFSIHSGVDGRILIQESGQVAGLALGSALATPGDMDGDGKEDFAVASLGGKGAVTIYHAENPDSGFGLSLRSLPDQDADGVSEILIGLPGRGQVEIHAGKSGSLFSVISPKDRGIGFGRSIDLDDLNLDSVPDLAIGGDALGVGIYSLATPALLASPGSWPVQMGGLQTWQISAGKSHAGKIYMVLGSLSGVSPGITLGSLSVPLNPDAYTSFSLAYPNQVPLLMSRGFLDLSGKAKAGLLLPPLDSSMKGLVFHHAFLVLGFSFSFEFASNPVPLLLR